MAEETFAIRSVHDGDIRMTRRMMRASLDSLLPRGFKYAVHYLRGAGMRDGRGARRAAGPRRRHV